MVEIRTLTHPDNVTLVRGATQHWSDLERGALGAASVVAGLISAQVHGRCLVVGPVDLALLADVSARAESVDAVVRSIPDSATYGERLPEGRVWCGDVADLPAEASGYDTIVCADLASVLPLGPVVPDAFGLVDPFVAATLPTDPSRVGQLFVPDATWWAANRAEARRRIAEVVPLAAPVSG